MRDRGGGGGGGGRERASERGRASERERAREEWREGEGETWFCFLGLPPERERMVNCSSGASVTRPQMK